MGLCKCEKKRVTNQFCFEHRVNVCENCMVDNHPKCVVQSYLQWLNDSDYNPVCQLCQEELVTAECMRLVCYDLFHKTCLDDWASKLPSNTAPAGYRCPVCCSTIFPAPNLVSPVADALRKDLETYEWARAGLGMPIVKSGSSVYSESHVRYDPPATSKLIETHISNLQADRGIPDGHDTSSNTPSPEQFHSLLGSSQHRNTHMGSSNKGKSPSESSSLYINEEDTGENKYKRRPAMDWLNRWLRTFQRPSSRHHQGLIGGKRRMSFLITVLTVCIIIVLLSFLGRSTSNDDPMLDPFNNPNIRIEEEPM